MRRRQLLGSGAAVLASSRLASPAIAQAAAKTLRFVPQANLANPDPIWTTATVAINHGYMVWDTLYGIDIATVPHPQMAAGHEVSDDKLTWTFTLRDGLLFHDNEKVRGADCVAYRFTDEFAKHAVMSCSSDRDSRVQPRRDADLISARAGSQSVGVAGTDCKLL